MLKDQFERFQVGDRFWYENDNTLICELKALDEEIDQLKKRKLSDVIRDNWDDKDGELVIQDDVFTVQ